MSEPIRILLIDDHTLLRESLVRYLEAESTLKIIGDCATVDEARAILNHSAVDVILLDYDLGEHVGIDLLPWLHTTHPATRVLMLTAGMSHAAMVGALHAGVCDVVLKQTGTRGLLEAIERAANGKSWWSPGTLLALKRTRIVPEAGSSPRELTTRQRVVLRGILDGLSNKEIAGRLDVSETSIKASIQELFSKAGVRSRSQLVRVTLERFASTWLQDEA